MLESGAWLGLARGWTEAEQATTRTSVEQANMESRDCEVDSDARD